jgi:5'-nucleotidase
MNTTFKLKKIISLGSLGLASTLLVSLVVPTAQANTYSLPGAPTNVTSYLNSRGVVVKWTPSTTVTPAITGYVVSAGPGSCPIFVSAKSSSVVTMPVVEGQPGGTPVVQAVNAYGFSKSATSNKSYTKEQLATVASNQNRAVQVLQLSDLHGAIEVGTSFGAALLASNWAADRAANVATVALSSGDNIGAAPPISASFEELPTIEALNLAKLDVSVFGNHEHDRNLDHLNKVIGKSDFQWVVSNYNPDSLAALKSGTKQAKNY